MKVLVIDATHGGITLSKAFMERGEDVTCVDVHKTITDRQIEELAKQFCMMRSMPDPSKYDLIVKPVHYPNLEFAGLEQRVVTHHQAVRILLKDRINFPIVEITGSFGKTTSAMCAISILGESKSILALTSKGISFTEDGNTKFIRCGVSAAPANIINAIDLSPQKPDLAIFEVSLGGTGMADLGIIKNVYDNYPIAKATSCALEAKLSMVNNRKNPSTVLINADDKMLSKINGVQKFSSEGFHAHVMANNVRVGASGISFDAEFFGFKSARGLINASSNVKTETGPLGRLHVENILVGISIVAYFGLGCDSFLVKREIFDHKMVLEKESPPLVVNRSASICAKVIETSIRDYLELFPISSLEIGGKLKTTCGVVDIVKVAEQINLSPFKKVTLFGEFGNALLPFIRSKELSVGIVKDDEPTLRIERG